MYKKRFIVDNDGCDIFRPEDDIDGSYESFIRPRLLPLVGHGATTLFYTTQSSGFGVFTHRTAVGDLFINNVDYEKPTVNIATRIFDRGTDCLHYVERFCRENGLEFFWGMRMNDTHDAGSREYFNQNLFKWKHPEYLVGSRDRRPPFGVWTSVDFIHEEVRERAFRVIEEVCQNYDVDGIFLDFFRHPVFFSHPAWVEHATEEERSVMTELMGRVRAMTEKEGEKRGRPIEIAMRVPDSIEFSNAIGLDIEEWLKRGYMDALITSGYFQLNDWEYSVELGHRYGVAVYPSLDESRISDREARSLRGAPPSMRGRCDNAMRKGADGIFFFNYIFEGAKPWQFEVIDQAADPEKMAQQEENFFADIRGAGHWMCYPYLPYRNATILNPEMPQPIRGTHTIDLYVGAELGSRRAELTIRCFEGSAITVMFNGVALPSQSVGFSVNAEVPAEILRVGVNHITCNGNGIVQDIYLTMK